VTRIIGLDVGDARIGVAVSDPLGLTAQPHSVIRRDRKGGEYSALQRIIEEFDVNRIVVGLPLNMDGSVGQQAHRVQKFADELRRLLPHIEIEFWDERLSSVASEQMLIDSGMRRHERRRTIDKVAATIILQTYLDRQRAQNTDSE
jgi:putative Holliday junction resolvase